MKSPLSALHALRKGFRAFFKADVRLQRAEGGVRVVLDDSGELPKSKSQLKAEQARRLEDEQLGKMRVALKDLLDDMPENRATLRHLVFIEHALEKKGARALYKVPLDTLKRAHDQFEGLVTNWSSEGLACLRSKMAVAIIDREVPGNTAEDEADAYRTAAVLDAPLAHPEPLDEQGALEAEAALLAAYGSLGSLADEGSAAPMAAVSLTPVAADTSHDNAEGQIEMQGELASPSARALEKAAKRKTALAGKVEIELRELQS